MSRKKTLISDLDLGKIGGRIAFLRISAGLTQAQLSKKTGISRGNISGLESNKFEPSVRAISKLVELFDVSSDWIIFGENPTDKDEPVTTISNAKEDLISKFDDSLKAEKIIKDLLMLENIDVEGFDEIHRIIKMKLEVKQDHIQKKMDERKKIS